MKVGFFFKSRFWASARSSWVEIFSLRVKRSTLIKISSEACHPEKSEDIFKVLAKVW